MILICIAGGVLANLGDTLRLSLFEKLRRHHQVREGVRPCRLGTRQSSEENNYHNQTIMSLYQPTFCIALCSRFPFTLLNTRRGNSGPTFTSGTTRPTRATTRSRLTCGRPCSKAKTDPASRRESSSRSRTISWPLSYLLIVHNPVNISYPQ